jgi:glycosyltransferase involved in cell wall biosynthesis
MKVRLKNKLQRARRSIRRALRQLVAPNSVGDGNVPRSLMVCTADECSVCGKRLRNIRTLRLVYMLPSDNLPCGGNKVSYRQCELIASQGHKCFVFHPDKPGARYTWFANNIETITVGHFDPRRDFLIFPEVWAALAARFCIPSGIRYAIFVQNGYLAHHSAGFEPRLLQAAYEHAAFVLSISSNTSQILSLLYPFVPPEKILRLSLSVGPMFVPGKKELLIAYMPRKLPRHSEALLLYLRNVLPPDWKLSAIDNLNERGVADMLGRSSIFLSFSELEGYGLPPVEAALAGNIVVGYTGQGGKEYFNQPIFREIENGDLVRFAADVALAIQDIKNGLTSTLGFAEQIKALRVLHSEANETKRLCQFVERVQQIMEPPVRISRT